MPTSRSAKAIAVLTLVFAPVKRATCRPPASHGEGAEGTASVLVAAVYLAGTPGEIVERVRAHEKRGLLQIVLYPPLSPQYRVIEDFATTVMSRF